LYRATRTAHPQEFPGDHGKTSLHNDPPPHAAAGRSVSDDLFIYFLFMPKNAET